jgi:S1-C subfamily serine protease
MSPKGIYNGIIVSRGNVETGTGISSSIVLANGDIVAVTGLYDVVIVCDGNVTLTKDNISNAVIIARGNIIVNSSADQADLFAGGKVSIGKVTGIPIRKYSPIKENEPSGKLPPRKDKDREKQPGRYNVIEENDPNPMGFITFFELSTVGVEVKVADTVVQISAVAAGKPCEKVGLKVGDTILEVNGKKPDSAESLRRLLRDALAVGDATVKLKRGNDTLLVKLSLPE